MGEMDSQAPPDSLGRRVRRLAGHYFNSEEKRRARRPAACVPALTLPDMAIQVRFNSWNRHLCNALERRDRPAFFGQMGLFVGLTLGSMAPAVFQLYVRQLLQLHWREWLVFGLQRRWLEGGRHCQLGCVDGAAD